MSIIQAIAVRWNLTMDMAERRYRRSMSRLRGARREA